MRVGFTRISKTYAPAHQTDSRATRYSSDLYRVTSRCQLMVESGLLPLCENRTLGGLRTPLEGHGERQCRRARDDSNFYQSRLKPSLINTCSINTRGR